MDTELPSDFYPLCLVGTKIWLGHAFETEEKHPEKMLERKAVRGEVFVKHNTGHRWLAYFKVSSRQDDPGFFYKIAKARYVDFLLSMDKQPKDFVDQE